MRYLWIIMLIIGDAIWVVESILDIKDWISNEWRSRDLWNLEASTMYCIGLHIVALFCLSLGKFIIYKLQ